MARPISVGKRIKQLVDDLLVDILGGRSGERKGKPPVPPTRLGRITQLNRIRAERPTRDLDTFAYVQEVLANMPAATAALRQLSEDVALDETGDPRAWTLAVKVDPIDEDAATADKIADFKDTCQKIFDEYALRTGIGDSAKNYVYKMMTAGDCFAEQIITLNSDGFGRIERIRELPTWQMRVIWDASGELTGYEQWLFGSGFANGPLTRSVGTNAIVWNIPAQIIHWKFHDTDYMPYGETIFAHLRNRWEQFKLVEVDCIAAIHTHAIDPTVVLLGGKDNYGERVSDEDIAAYEQKLRDNPADINRFFVGRQGEVEYDFPKTGTADAVQKLVEAHRDLESRFVEAIVPGQAKGNPFDATRRSVATSYDQKYARKVSSIRQDFTRYLRASIFLEFALHGIDWVGKPEQYGAKKISMEISWPDISESRQQRSKRIIGEWVVGMTSHETSLRQLGFNDTEGELDILKREHEEDDYPLALIMGSMISPNNDQGKGVPKDQSDSSDGKNASSIRAEIQTGILRSIFSDPEEIRDMIREELQSLLDRRAE